jgi:prepilin-type N-terminal cleavage/methylation domain-containing protein
MKRRAFSLVEMLVATVLSAVLMSAVLAMIAGVSRDRRTLTSLNADTAQNGATELFRWDLSNAQSLAIGPGSQMVILVGVGGVDAATLVPNGRLVRVTYRMQSDRTLWRVQEYLDDPARPQVWEELVAANVTSFSVFPGSNEPSPVPSHLRLRLAAAELRLDQDLWIK